MLRLHVPVQIFKRSIAARANTVSNAVLDLGHLTACGSGAPISGLSISAKLPYVIVSLRYALGKLIALSAHLIKIGLANIKYH